MVPLDTVADGVSPEPEARYVRRDRRLSDRPLADVATELKQGRASVTALFETFVRSRLYLPRPPKPGFVIMEFRGRPVVAVFSSELELARFAGRIQWFSTDGFDLLHALPAGLQLVLDIASPHRLQIDPSSVRVDTAIYLPLPSGRRDAP
jgi:hypothetical protein